MNSVERTVITELWRLPGEKAAACLLGDFQSCDMEDPPVVSVGAGRPDWRAGLVPGPALQSGSDCDTDELVEDAREFVRAASAGPAVWQAVEAGRERRRASRRTRDAARVASTQDRRAV